MLRYRSLANFLVKKGYRIDVIGFYNSQEEYKDGITYYQIKKRTSLGLLLWSIVLFFSNLYLLFTMSFTRYINRIGLAAITLVQAQGLIRKNNYDSCLISIAPWSYYLIVKQLAKKVRVVLDICDPLYKNAIVKNSANSFNLLLEKRALESADVIVTVNEPTIAIMTDEMKIPREKIHFIAPAMAVDSYRNNTNLSYAIHRPLKLIYSGSLYKGYRDLTEVQAAVDGNDLNVEIDVFTNNSASYCSSKRIKYYDWIDHQDLLCAYKDYDLLLFLDNSYGYQVPSKIFEMLAQNKPIVFVYDKRNLYFYNMLKGQKGLFFTENKIDSILKCFEELLNKKSLEVCYTFDMSDYKEEVINMRLFSVINITD